MQGEDGLLSKREGLGNTVTFGSSRGKPQICPKGIWENSSKKVTQLIAQLKCLCMSYSMGNKEGNGKPQRN